jgi:hypothetical protein
MLKYSTLAAINNTNLNIVILINFYFVLARYSRFSCLDLDKKSVFLLSLYFTFVLKMLSLNHADALIEE